MCDSRQFDAGNIDETVLLHILQLLKLLAHLVPVILVKSHLAPGEHDGKSPLGMNRPGFHRTEIRAVRLPGHVAIKLLQSPVIVLHGKAGGKHSQAAEQKKDPQKNGKTNSAYRTQK